MEPNRHYEYQTHHHQSHIPLQHQHQHQHQVVHSHPQHTVHSNHIQHHQHQQQSAATATAPPPLPPPPPQQQQQHHLQPLPHQHQAIVNSSTFSSSSIGYHNSQRTDAERSRAATYVMNARCVAGGGGGGAAASVMPPIGAAAAAALGGDPHLQYYTSNRELGVGERSTEPPSSHLCWQYKTEQETSPTGAAPAPAPAPMARHHSSAMYNAAPHWPPPQEEQQQPSHLVHQQDQQSRYGYSSKSQTPTHRSAISSSSGNGSNHRYYEDNNIKYSSAVPGQGAKVLSYAPAVGSASSTSSQQQQQQLTARSSRYDQLEHVVNPTNVLLGTSDQQPSPNYARKCPQHYDPPTEQHSAAAPVTPSAISHHMQHTQQQQQQQHQSLYMPSNFQNTMHNAIEKYVRETGPSPSLDYRRSGANYSRPTVSFYGKAKAPGVGGSSSSNAYVKLESETPALARSSLYHNPYNPPTAAPPEKEQSASAISSRGSSPAAPLIFPTKYGKLLQQHAAPTPTAPQILPSGAAFQHRSSSSSTSSHASYYHHGTPSPAAAQVASPTPAAQQLYTHTPPPACSGTASTSNYSMLQVYPHGPDICCHQPAPVASKPALTAVPRKTNSSTAKPNYRALINDMLKRNTTSEEERNLQIIKKTLNMETPDIHLALIPTTSRQSPSAINIAVPTMPAPVIQQQMQRPLPPPVPPATYSPLDLSMRTVKQTADSTDYKYQGIMPESKPTASPQPVTVTGGGQGLGLGLPRFDITPNFARSTSSRAASSTAAATAVIRQAPASVAAAAVAAPADATPMLIKAAQQLRPSVVETNPYAKRPQLPPETTISNIETSPSPLTAGTTTTTTSNNSHVPSAGTSVHNSSNPNYLGRKRHLQEYNQATAAAEAAAAAAKQTRLESPQPKGAMVASVPVIAINEQALAAKRLELPATGSSQGRIIVGPQPSQEPVVRPKPEPRIRTKAELKGFTFTPPVLAPTIFTTTTAAAAPVSGASESTTSVPVLPPTLHPPSHLMINHIQIKTEPMATPELDLDLELDVKPSSFNSNSLLDWGSTCNNLVEQLLSKVMPVKVAPASANESLTPALSQSLPLSPLPLPLPSSSIKLELSEDDLPVARILKRQPALVDVESAATTTTQVTNTTIGAQKKLSKTDREKKRIVQEQRIAARLAPAAGQSSSSESDTTELHKRKTARQKKPLMMRKGKVRRAEDKKQLKHREQQGSDEEQEQDGVSNSSSEAKNNTISLMKTRIAIATENIVQYAGGKCKAKKKSVNARCEKVEQKLEGEDDQEDKSNSSSCNSDVKEKQHQQEEDDDDDDDEDDDERRQDAGAAAMLAKEGKKADQVGIKRKANASNLRANAQLKNRIALNTMTRSKRKKELELQLANSKVLRNEKIIRNSTTKIKRKYVRKMVPDGGGKKELMMSTRLRNKRASVVDLTQLNGRKIQNKPGGASSTPNSSTNKGNKTNTSPQQQLILEEYRYKVALKIPQRLISMNKLNKLPQMAASLPDLERGRDFRQELACFKPICGRKPRTKQQQKQHQQQKQQQEKAMPKSIIDVLHLRVTSNNSSSSHQGNKNNASSHPSNCSASLHNYSETSQTSASNSLYEAHSQEAADPSLEDTMGKRHFSIFDTKVLQSKTRTESKLQQRREVIREIFVGTDPRPASAPPECAQDQAGGEEYSALSYQHYEDFLEQMNRIVSANNNKLARHSITNDKTNHHTGKTDSPTTTTTSTVHCAHKRKYLRRKGSSGFDYIRKKKKSTQQHHQSSSANSTTISTTLAAKTAGEQVTPLLTTGVAWTSATAADAAADERLDDTDSTIAGSTSHLPIKIKTEMDVCREIQKWVLNKGVGQSTMHKAARQGLIDVVVYCLDRMGMNPDQKDNAGYTPLHEACTQGWLEIARILLQFGANHSEAAQSGIRPLHGAIENDHEEVVRLLLSYGADPLLATYSGQTPLMLASSKLMCSILRSHLSDAQSAAADIKPMRFLGPWELFNEKEYGFDIFDSVPKTACDMSRAQLRERRRQKRNQGDNENHPAKHKTNSNSRHNTNNSNGLLQTKADSKEIINQNGEICGKTATTTTTTATIMFKIEPGAGLEDTNNNKNNDINVEQNVTGVVNGKNEVKQEPQDDDENMNIENNEMNDDDHIENDDSDVGETLSDELNSDIFKFEEADVPLPPLYLLKDEGSDKWVLLNDLCNLLKVKSKDTLLNKICPNGNTLATTHKQLLREFKIDDFLEQATCLQLLCAGEKLNMFSSSKVMLIRYNESVKNLLGVKTILMKF
ncbi:uncharacterized protein LOC6558026 [Drosophila grimshawi]|uniref:GH17193 n=1 Tax=Drosophila grimshawi TaxID=7222 RepID=B4J1T5_DROGR|nr:uncharacterized protein LOC6558026 [Drosophila grimshawi]EDV98015.1 GH17193 [Drosophila grimshawi]